MSNKNNKKQMSIFDTVYVLIWQEDLFDNVVEIYRNRENVMVRAVGIVDDNAVTEDRPNNNLEIDYSLDDYEYYATWIDNKVTVVKREIND